jgi:hypothetical protein
MRRKVAKAVPMCRRVYLRTLDHESARCRRRFADRRAESRAHSSDAQAVPPSRLVSIIRMKDSFWDTDLRNGDLLAGGNPLTETVKLAPVKGTVTSAPSKAHE